MVTQKLGPAVAWLRRITGGTHAGVTDHELLGRFHTHRDEAAFELLVWRHRRMVHDACRRILGDEHDAEDAFQAAFLVLARKGHTVGRPECLAAWLYRVTVRCSLNARAARARRRGREVPLLAAGDVAGPEAPDAPAATAERRELRGVLDEELLRLPERLRAPAVLCYLGGRTVTEAADQLGCPPGTVASRLARARQRLRGRLARRGLALPAIATGLAAAAGAAPAGETLLRATLHAVRHRPPGRVVTLADTVIRAMLLRNLLRGGAALAVLAALLLAGGGLAVGTPTQADPAHQPPKLPPPVAGPPPAPPAAPAVPPLVVMGTLEPSQQLRIATRAGGPVEKVAVKLGDDVKKGDLLFEVGAAAARDALQRAIDGLTLVRAAHAEALTRLERLRRLFATGALPQAEVVRAEDHVRQLTAEVRTAEANVVLARSLVEAAAVRAPIAARVTEVSVGVGDLVRAGDDPPPLATLAVIDPILVHFQLDAKTPFNLQRGPAGQVEVEVGVIAAGEKGFPHKAAIRSVSVDPNTHTLDCFATMPNPQRRLLPGMAVRVRLAAPP